MPPMPKKEILSPNQAAELLMVSPATVRLWASKGQLKALSTPGGHRRFRMSDIKIFAKSRSITLNLDNDEKISILIVDDDTQFAGYLQELIPTFDPRIEVQSANDGYEAGKLVHIFKPDLILMDLMMPSMDGFETCRSIKEDPDTADIKIICMTGYGSQENIDKIMLLGAEACITKPIDEDELEQQIQLVLA